jgi:hypothetical protein
MKIVLLFISNIYFNLYFEFILYSERSWRGPERGPDGGPERGPDEGVQLLYPPIYLFSTMTIFAISLSLQLVSFFTIYYSSLHAI